MSSLNENLAKWLTILGLSIALPPVAALACGARVRSSWMRVAAWLGLGFYVGRNLLVMAGSLKGWDLLVFWKAGRDLLAGRDLYEPVAFADRPVFNLPSTYPIFEVMALVPFEIANAAWLVLTAALALILVPIACSTIREQEGEIGPETPGGWSVSPVVAWLVAVAVVLSNANVQGLDAGQFTVVTAFCMYVALWSQSKRDWASSGVALALGTAKIGTMLPFFLLFIRRRDVRTLSVMGLTLIGLCALAVPLGDVPRRCQAILRLIGEYAGPGMVNDYAYTGPHSDSVIGFEHTLFRLGLRDRGLISKVMAVLLLALGGLVAVEVAWRRTLARGAACSLVALFSVLFLYHRLYDLVTCALPLAYAIGRAQSNARSRRWFGAAALTMLVAMNLPRQVFITFLARSSGWGQSGRILQGLILPMATWLILAAILFVWIGARVDRRERAIESGPIKGP